MATSGKLSGKRVAIYARFSSDSQREASIDDQVRRCREHVQREAGAIDPALVFTDYAISGGSLARAGFEAMMRAVDAKRVDAIVCEDLSRVTRDLADGAELFKRLQFAGVPLIGIADGIDTGARGSKIAYTIKNLLADAYLDDLRDKTLRGLEGRQLAGMSTGGLAFGYRSAPVLDAFGRVTGHAIEVDPTRAELVRLIFSRYLAGQSLASIAKQLVAEGVPPPRAHTAHRRKGWCDSTIRAMLHQEKYAGVWRFKERQWVKVPGTNRRQPRKRPEAEVMTAQRPELAIIDRATWEATRTRLAAVSANYSRAGGGKRGATGKVTRYLLSGLLHCPCGVPMTIIGGGVRYYRCPDHSRRGICSNGLGVQEVVARECILAGLRDRLLGPTGLAHVRKRIAERLGELGRAATAEVSDRRGRLARTEARIAGLVGFIAAGDRSDYVVTALRDLEAQARQEKAAIAGLEASAGAAVRLPSPAELERLVMDLQLRLEKNPVGGREELRRLFKGGRIDLEVAPGGRFYVTRASLLPLVLLGAEPGNTNALPEGESERASGATDFSAAEVAGARYAGCGVEVAFPYELRRAAPLSP